MDAESRPRGGSFIAVFIVAGVLTLLAMALLYLRATQQEVAELAVYGVLGALAVVGVLGLFCLSVGLLTIRKPKAAPIYPPLVLDHLSDAVAITDAGGKLLYANPTYRRWTGHDGSDGRGLERVVASEAEAAETVFRLSQNAQSGKKSVDEVRMRRPFGATPSGPQEPRWYRIEAQPIDVEQKNNIASQSDLCWRIADITRDRERQETIFQELQGAIDYLDHAPAGFISIASDGTIIYINATLASWLGYDLADLVPGELTTKMIAGEAGRSLLTAAVPDAGTSKTETIDLDLISKSGQTLPVRLIHNVSMTLEGRISDSRTLVLNLAAGTHSPDAAAEAEARFSRFFNNTPIAIAAINKDGLIGKTNAPFLKLVGGDANSIRGKPLASIGSGADLTRLEAAIKEAVSGQADVAPVELSLKGDGDRAARFFVTAVPNSENASEAAIAYIMETTEQRALQNQFTQSQKMQAVGQLAGGVAHDFNNVLTAIIGFSDLLLANHRPSDPAFQDIMNIKQNANRAAGLVRQLLAFSRRQTLRPKELDLNAVMEDLRMLLDRLLGENITLNLDPVPGLWRVMADHNQLEQVIVNLAVNARDAMNGKGTLTISMENIDEEKVSSLDYKGMVPGEYVLINAADTGTGIPPEIMEKIFDPFFSTKEVGKGTGLGLSTVYGIIKQTGGYIYVDSELGKGAEFKIFLPRQITAENDEPADEVAQKEPSKDLTGTATILLVEDEEAVRAFSARALKSRGYTVHEAVSGVEALEIMDEIDGEIDLVVSDVVMPEIDGPTLLGKLRAIDPKIRFIFVSGYAEEAFSKNLPEGEQFQFLPKPFSLKQLAEAVKGALEEDLD